MSEAEHTVEPSKATAPESKSDPNAPKPLEDDEFFQQVIRLSAPAHEEEMDKSDFQFLTDFSICSLTFTVYNELNLGTFFKKDDGAEDISEEEKQIRSFDTKGRFRLAQVYPVVVRAVLGYYAHIAHAYYTATINTRRRAQVPIGLNDKAYSVVCGAIRRLVLETIRQENDQDSVEREVKLERQEEVDV